MRSDEPSNLDPNLLPEQARIVDPREVSFDETLGSRIRDLLDARDDVDEQRMFGGIAFLLTGKPFVGCVYVAPAGVKTKAALQQWVDSGLEFASTLPIKGAKKAAKKQPAKKPAKKR